MTHEQFAEKVGVTYQTIQMVESGQQTPNRLTKTKILSALVRRAHEVVVKKQQIDKYTKMQIAHSQKNTSNSSYNKIQ